MSAERDSIVDPKQRLRCGPGDVGLFASHFIFEPSWHDKGFLSSLTIGVTCQL